MEQHKAFLRQLMKGCLLSRKVAVLRTLLSLKDLAMRFVKVSDDAASVPWDALDEEVEQKCMGSGVCVCVRESEREKSVLGRACAVRGRFGWSAGLGIEGEARSCRWGA